MNYKILHIIVIFVKINELSWLKIAFIGNKRSTYNLTLMKIWNKINSY